MPSQQMFSLFVERCYCCCQCWSIDHSVGNYVLTFVQFQKKLNEFIYVLFICLSPNMFKQQTLKRTKNSQQCLRMSNPQQIEERHRYRHQIIVISSILLRRAKVVNISKIHTAATDKTQRIDSQSVCQLVSRSVKRWGIGNQ